MNELKPCPFCGGKVVVDYNRYANTYSVACDNDKCNICVETLNYKTSEQAIEAWNRRADNATD